MSPRNHDIEFEELSGLIIRELDGSLGNDEFTRLENMLSHDPAKVQYYVKAIMTHAIMVDKSGMPITEGQEHGALERLMSESATSLDAASVEPWKIEARLHDIERCAQEDLQRFQAQERQRQEELALRQYCAYRRRCMVAAGSLAALIAIVLFAWITPNLNSDLPEPVTDSSQFVATIMNVQHAQWEPGTFVAKAGMPLKALPLFLKQGLVQLAFTDGAEVMLQGPCQFELMDTGRLFIASGVASAWVPLKAAGFVVETPLGKVTDFGTEFGIIVHLDGALETHVYEGQVQLENAPQQASSPGLRFLDQGEACTMDVTGRFNDALFDAKRFVRVETDLDAFGIPGMRVDLSDVLVGGCGFGTGDPNQMVDIRTGRVSDIHYNSANSGLIGQEGLISQTLPCVDFLFAPDGGAGPVQVSSVGHQFDMCPDTDGATFYYVSNRGMVRHIPGVVATQVLNGREYGTRSNPVIAMHANAGITFDLQAIRSMLSGSHIQRFTALCGLSETVAVAVLRESGQAAQHYADFWVLVDGQERFRRQGLQVQSGGIPITIDLADEDRFLTLMVTDGGDGNGFDWGAFAKPALELEAGPKHSPMTNELEGR